MTAAVLHDEALTPEEERALDIARTLIRAGVPVFAARPNGEGEAWCPQGGHQGTGYWFPTGWDRTVATEHWLDPTARSFERKAWRPGWALCAVMGHMVDGSHRHPACRRRPGGARRRVPAVQLPRELRDRYHCDVVPSPSGVVHHLFWRR